jgi:divalent metal cation (Fe/Co/Zn/Cd) transporter
MVLAAVGETYSLVVVLREFKIRAGSEARDHKNPILLALAIENSVDILGVLLALAGYGLYMLTGNALWDAAFSLGIATLLACTSMFLIRRNRSLIVGEVASQEVEEAIREVAANREFAVLVRVTALMRGPNDVECHLEMRWNKTWFAARAPFGEPVGIAVALALAAATAEIEALKSEIKTRANTVTRITVEIT